MNWKNLVRAVIFTIVLVTVISSVSVPFVVPDGYTTRMDYRWIKGMYNEPKGTLDAIYIGSSNAYAYWNQNIAWSRFGITVYPYACAEAPLTAYEYMLKEAHREHPDAVYILSVNTLGETTIGEKDVVLHRVLDHIPMSMNKLLMIDHLCDIAEVEYEDRLEYVLPIIKYHSAWDEIGEGSFDTDTTQLKNGNTFSWFFEKKTDISKKYKESDKMLEPADYVMESVNGILDYCEKEDLKVLFVTAPRAEKEVATVEKINYINNYVKERGYETLDIMALKDEYDLNLKIDFYNITHTNIHGSLKYTMYLSEYLVEKYGFEDKRGQEEYASWDESANQYLKKVDGLRVMPFEYDLEARRNDIDYPANLKGKVVGKEITLSWSASTGATGYEVYKRNKYNSWFKVGETAEVSFTDKGRAVEGTHQYRVIPFVEVDGERQYGQYYYPGVTVNGK